MLAAAQAAGEFPSFQAKPGSPEYQAELRQLGDPGRPRHPLPLQDARCVRTTEHPDLGPNPCIRAALGNRGGLFRSRRASKSRYLREECYDQR
jgi:hypothetical protein